MFNKITEHVYIHPAEHYTDRPNIGLIFGEKHSLLFDAGNSADHVEKLKRELSEQGLPFPDFVLLSHWHWDHSFGAKFWNVPIISGRKTNEELEKVSEWKWDDFSMENRIKSGEDIIFCTEMIKREYPDRSKIEVVPADIVFEDKMVLDLGGISCELIHAKGPHSEDSVICFVPSEKFVFLGDANCKDLYGKPWEFDIEHEEDFLSNVAKIPYDKELVADFLKLLEKLDFTYCISGHSEIMTREELFESFSL
ncbi:MAG: MBL fold metallo-hydrolase [Oscillospiraceae bacterium]|nr:MBL fold metallo-hydrolase [Oscillospiraceae bacterium]